MRAMAESIDLSERGTLDLINQARSAFDQAVLESGDTVSGWLAYRREVERIVHRQNVLARHYNRSAEAEAQAAELQARSWDSRIREALYGNQQLVDHDELDKLRAEVSAHLEACGIPMVHSFFNYGERTSVTPERLGFKAKLLYTLLRVDMGESTSDYSRAVSEILRARVRSVEGPEGVAMAEVDIKAETGGEGVGPGRQPLATKDSPSKLTRRGLK